jgi:hypothetical protein
MSEKTRFWILLGLLCLSLALLYLVNTALGQQLLIRR